MMAKKSNNLSSPLLYIILGALLVIFRSQMLSLAITIAGILFIAIGILDLTKKRTNSGLINIVIGALILIVGNTILSVVLIVLGVLIALKGLMELIEVLKRKRSNALQVIFPALTIVIGIALAFGDALGDLIVIIGVLLIVDGVLGLIGPKK